MSANHKLEFTVGLFVAMGLLAFFILAMRVSDVTPLGDSDTYTVQARFQNVGGLYVRAPVTLAGVRIGRVASIGLNPTTFEAVVDLAIDRRYRLPTDTSASILTAGVVGEQYIGLEPGGMDEYLSEGGEIVLTQSALVLERLIGRFLTSIDE